MAGVDQGRIKPHAGKPAIDDFTDLVDLSVAVGEILTARVMNALGDAKPIGYGKAALVGTDGDLEHGAAMIHVRIGRAMRKGAGAGPALIPGNAKVGAAGAPIDIIFGGMHDAWDYNAMDSMTISIPDAPRPNARIAGASPEAVAALMRNLA